MATSPGGLMDARARALKLLRRPIIIILVVVGFGLWLMNHHFDAARIAYERSPEARAEAARQADQSAIDLAQTLVSAQLRDPGSAEFLGSKVVRQGKQQTVCGMVNGRNGFGGMVGYQTFAVIDGEVILAQSGKAWNRANAI